MNSQPAIMQLVDSLETGGAERVAVNLANGLARCGYQSHLCATRSGGPLRDLVQSDVRISILHKRRRGDLKSIYQLHQYVRENGIDVLHAHATSGFAAALLRRFNPRLRVVWHDHYGRQDTHPRPAGLYRLLRIGVDQVISVNSDLKRWAVSALGFHSEAVTYLPNFVAYPKLPESSERDGASERVELVCVANFRPQKDHLMLLHAMRLVVNEHPSVHLSLIGGAIESDCGQQVRSLLRELQLERNVSILGQRDDVARLLRQADIGVLSSRSEGLPLSLLEYGHAGLAVCVTEVGQCREVLAGGELGSVVQPGNPESMAAALMLLIRNPCLRVRQGRRLRQHVERNYGETGALESVGRIYAHCLGSRGVN